MKSARRLFHPNFLLRPRRWSDAALLNQVPLTSAEVVPAKILEHIP